RIVVTAAAAALPDLRELAARHGVAAGVLGQVTDGRLAMRRGEAAVLDEATEAVAAIWKGAIPWAMGEQG
ncbi:MAG TPA: hypothetical protein DEQ28_02405, partial [Clostridiales bacterium]|nr:hypothetical protein [Clostridiales bacterium]